MEPFKPHIIIMSEIPKQQTISTQKLQQSKNFEMYESDHSVSSEDSRDDGIIIPDPATLLNLHRSLAWSQDSEESKNSIMEMDDAGIASFGSSLSAKLDQTNGKPQQNDDKENGVRPVHWEQQVLSQQSLQSFYRDYTIWRYRHLVKKQQHWTKLRRRAKIWSIATFDGLPTQQPTPVASSFAIAKNIVIIP